MLKLSPIGWVALVLAIIGGLNWGLVGVFSFDLVKTLFGDMSAVSRIVYILVGLSAIYLLVMALMTSAGASSPMTESTESTGGQGEESKE